MKTIALIFQIHQPYILKKYRFFDIGKHHFYFDDFFNKTRLNDSIENCYAPLLELLKKALLKYNNDFKVAFSISGTTLKLIEHFNIDFLYQIQELSNFSQFELLGGTYSHSLASLSDKKAFKTQVLLQEEILENLFNRKPHVFCNSELIYNDEIGSIISELGYCAAVTEGAKHILGWKSPNFLYFNTKNPKLKLFLRNYQLCDDLSFKFSNKNWNEYPLTSKKFVRWLQNLDKKEETINLVFNAETFGNIQTKETGIFNFLNEFIELVVKNEDFMFSTPSEICKIHQPIAPFSTDNLISWADNERDITAWLGNDMQKEAFEKLYNLSPKMKLVKNVLLKNTWLQLQNCDHFYYMDTKLLSDGSKFKYYNPYNNPYDAFINYMNVLSDFTKTVENDISNNIDNNDSIVEKMEYHENEIKNLKKKLKKQQSKNKKY